MTPDFQVIQWRDIPAQGKVRSGKKRKGLHTLVRKGALGALEEDPLFQKGV